MSKVTQEFLTEQGFSPTFAQRFWDKVDRNGPVPPHVPWLGKCWLFKGSAYIFAFYVPGIKRGKSICASVASYILHFGTVPEGKEVCHRCDFGLKNEYLCVNPDHLFADTHDGNMKDMVSKGRGRGLVGEAHNMSKLTEKQVMEIRKLYDPSKHNGHEIAVRFGLSRGSVYRIIKGEVWSHVPGARFANQDLTWRAITQEKADEIRKAYAQGLTTYRALAKRYHVANGTIQSVLSGRTWNNVK